MRNLPSFLLMAMVASGINGCKFDNESDVKSSFAIDAGQDAAIRNGAAPTFILLSDWFQKFKVDSSSKSDTKEHTSTHALLTKIPKKYHKALIEYLDVQIKRNAEIMSAINNDKKDIVNTLLSLEVDEMYDIAAIFLDRNHKLITKDLFATFIKLTWEDDFVDQFGVGFTDIAVTYRSLKTVTDNLKKESDSYKSLLLNKYKKEGFSKLANDLNTHLQALSGMRGALNGELSLVQTDYEVGGMPAAFASFSNQYFQAGEAGSFGQGAVPSFLSAATETKVAGSEVENVSVGNGFTPSNGGGGFNPNGGGGFNPSNNNEGNFDPYGPPEGINNQTIIMNNSQNGGSSKYMPADWYQREIQTSKYATTIGEPNHDCRKFNLTGIALIRCQRYLAYTGLKKSTGLGLQNQQGLSNDITTPQAPPQQGASTDTSVGSNLKLIKDGATRVINQGSVPSCTSASLTGILESMAKVRGKNITLDYEALWRVQGEQATNPEERTSMIAAQNAVNATFSSEGIKLISADPVTSLAQIIDGLNVGQPAHLGINITPEWTAEGGGNEFIALTAGGPPVYGCQAGNDMGHAISILGYMERLGKVYLIFKNSWGASWADNGFALLDPVSCLPTADGAVIQAEFNK